MEKLKKSWKFALETYQKWKGVESKRIKILSVLGAFFPLILLGVYYTMKTFFPKYLMFLLIAIMPACQSIDSKLLEDLERQNHEIVQAHLKDNYDNPLMLQVRKEKGFDYYKRLLNDLVAKERAQLRSIYEFWRKLEKDRAKEAGQVIENLIYDFDKNWESKQLKEPSDD